MRFMQTESVLQTKNRSRRQKNRFSVALFCYALQSFGHVNYVCDLRLQYCTKSEKGNLLKLVSEVFIFRKKVLKEKNFFSTDPICFFRVSPETQVFFFWPQT